MRAGSAPQEGQDRYGDVAPPQPGCPAHRQTALLLNESTRVPRQNVMKRINKVQGSQREQRFNQVK